MLRKIVLAVAWISVDAMAAPDFQARAEYCAELQLSQGANRRLSRSDRAYLLAFKNQGGLKNAGICWWHSRFTRNAAYLALYRPDLRKPGARAGRELVTRLREGRQVTEIPGYANLREFSLDFRSDIQVKMEDWQKSEGFLGGHWATGLTGTPSVSETRMAELMDELYARTQTGDTIFQVLQLPGVSTHAWLVTGMRRLNDGYEIDVIESNLPGPTQYAYKRGMQEFEYLSGSIFTPYTQFENEVPRMRKAIAEFCGKSLFPGG